MSDPDPIHHASLEDILPDGRPKVLSAEEYIALVDAKVAVSLVAIWDCHYCGQEYETPAVSLSCPVCPSCGSKCNSTPTTIYAERHPTGEQMQRPSPVHN